MAQSLQRHEAESVQQYLLEVQTLLARHKLVESLVERENDHGRADRHAVVETLVHRQHEAELRAKLDLLHPADVAFILEALPLDERLFIWNLVKAERDGEILLEVSDAVRESIIATMDSQELVEAAGQLDTDEIADLAPDLPREVMADVFRLLPLEEREQLREAMSYSEGSVGALMDFEHVQVRDDVSLEVVLRYLRRLDVLPDHTDQIFVVDRNDILKGVLSVNRMLVSEPDAEISQLLLPEIVRLEPDEEADNAAQAFERYDLVSAPVVDKSGKLIGRVTVNNVVDFIREESESDKLREAGLREEEDIFASVWQSAKNRWLWLAVNMCTAIFASRVIGAFEGTIVKIVALATLMPIVAGIAGNSGNQTTTLMIRSIALGQINPANARRLLLKELAISALNGVVWGGIAGTIAYLLYGNAAIGLVMMAAMLLNLVVGALVGIFVPLTMHKLGRDPAIGSSVLLTFTTDSMGFFIFLGLATLFLI